jgi:D-beta-D-heptose 7-phosphate kinase/D-beta-D-heptose 1-phosphate adenosyltransferase
MDVKQLVDLVYGRNSFCRVRESWRDPVFLADCARLKDAGYRLGVTNGVFDLLHVGHVSLFRRIEEHYAKLPGFVLIVLVNGDASAATLKPGRPFLPLAERLCMVQAIRSVYAAIGFDEDDPSEALAAIKPDTLFKGAEYTGKPVLGAEYVRTVKLLPMLEGIHTTDIVERIIRAERDKRTE